MEQRLDGTGGRAAHDRVGGVFVAVIHAASPQMTVGCEGHRRRLTPPSNLWLICKGSLARARALRGECPPHPPFGARETSCFHAPACVPARSGDWENRVNSKTFVGVTTKESVFVILAGRRGSRRGVAAQMAAALPPVFQAGMTRRKACCPA